MEDKKIETPEEIKETELTTVKTPWWKTALRIGGYDESPAEDTPE